MSAACSLAAWKVTAPTLAVTRRRDAVQRRRVVADAVDDGSADPLGAVLVGVGEQDGELVAAQPRDHVGVADGAAQQAADGDQELVAGVVAEGVVDLLEVVEVEQQQRAARAVAPAPLEVALELGVEAAPVGQAGEHVVVDEVGEPVLVAAPLGDVDDVDQDDVGLVGSWRVQQPAAQGHVDVLAPGVAQDAVGRARAGDVLVHARQVVGDRGVARWRELHQPHALELVRRQADDPAQRSVDELDPALVSSTATPCGASRKSGRCARRLSGQRGSRARGG